MSDTPRTDAACFAVVSNDPQSVVVWADFARQLERDLATLRSLAYDMAAEMEQHGGEMAFHSLARYRAEVGKEAKP